MKPSLLDLFCGAGGCAAGYARAGFDVVQGVDITDHPDYPYHMIVADAMEILKDREYLSNFDVVHASPPCQLHTRAKHLRDAQGGKSSAIDLLTPTLELLQEWGGVWIVENVPGAPFTGPTAQVCGSSFGLRVRRHRLFQSSVPLQSSVCDHKKQGRPVGVYHVMGDDIPQGGRTARDLADGQDAMGIDWMQWKDLKESVPPAYTEFLGRQILAHMGESEWYLEDETA